MKKIVMLALCMAVLASGAFALDKTVGGGILYNNTSTIGDDGDFEETLIRDGFGAFAFFGISQFLELNLGLLYKNPKEYKYKNEYGSGTISGSDLTDYLDSSLALQLGIYGKLPIPISDMLVFFPTVGVDFELSLDDTKTDLGWKWWHDLWLRAGVGLDVFFNEKIFIRTHIIYGYAVPIGAESIMNLQYGHGLLLKVGIGFML
jgi:hypothetical protein